MARRRPRNRGKGRQEPRPQVPIGPPRDWVTLPNDVMELCLTSIRAEDRLAAFAACKAWATALLAAQDEVTCRVDVSGSDAG